MKAYSLFLLIIIATTTGFSQTKKVAIQVNVLGKKHPTVRYYHPINGNYNIEEKIVRLEKPVSKALKKYVLIEPFSTLHDSLNYIQANSLRHYVNPSELIYVDWRMGIDSSNYLRLDTFKSESKNLRNEKYASTVQHYFNPFFISKYEVTNYEYRQFIHWVKDSIFREAIYASDSITNTQALKFLKIEGDLFYNEATLKWESIASADRGLIRTLYPLNFDYDYRKEIKDEIIISIISNFFIRPNERYYKSREIDSRKLNYRYYSLDAKAMSNRVIKIPEKVEQNSAIRHHEDLSQFIIEHNLNVYPDTISWIHTNTNTFNDAYTNLYFWHPAFNYMPVVGVSHEQASAFCHWKQKQLQKSHPEIAKYYSYNLPNMIEYEWAIMYKREHGDAHAIQDDELVTNLYLSGKNEVGYPQNYAYNKSLLQKTFRPYDIQNPKEHNRFLKMIKKQEKKGYSGFFGTNREIIMRSQGNYLQSGVEFLSNNASEWMHEDYQTHYQALFEAYINYNCFSDPEYCEHQRHIDQNFDRANDKNGHLIMGSNWYDERYGSFFGVNKEGLYAKRFKEKSSSYATVGFRLVLRMNTTQDYP